MRFLKSQQFWGGFIVGAFVGPWVMHKFVPGMKARIPQQ